MAGVTLRGITKEFGEGVVAVDHVDLEIADREFMVLVGPSGCGKSTLLRMIAGLEDPDEGEVRIGDRVVNDVAPKDRNIAMVFQDYALYPHMSAFDNMAFSLKLRRVPRQEIRQKVEAVAATLGLQKLLGRKPKDLSGGERQRVALGRAIVREPDVFLFDEPLSNLDARLRGEMRMQLQKLHRSLDTTMIYVTHDQMEAMTMGDRIVVLRDGRIQQVADPLTLYDRPANRFVGGFIGSPPMNQFEGVIEGDERPAFGRGAIRIPLASPRQWRVAETRDVILGVRCEDIHACDESREPAQSAFSARVEVVEPLGSETLLSVLADDVALAVRIPPGRPPRVGDRMRFMIDPTRIHVFATAGGEALGDEVASRIS